MKLFINELAKDYKKKTTWLYLILVAGLLSINSLMYAYSYSKSDTYPLSREILGSSLGAAVNIALVFVLIMFANNITQEYSKGTAKFLYTRPKSRSSILTSKICVAIFNFIFFSVFAFAFDVLSKNYIFMRGKITLSDLVRVKASEGHFDNMLWKQLLIEYGAFFAVTLFFISLVLFICLLFKTQILSVIVVIVMLLGQGLIDMLVAFLITKFEYAKYIFTNIMQLYYYYYSETARESVKSVYKLNSTSLLIMALSWTVLFMLISYIIHARRDITLD